MRTDCSFFDEFIFLRIQKLRNIDFFCYDCSGIFEIKPQIGFRSFALRFIQIWP